MEINQPSRNLGKTELIRQLFTTLRPLTDEEFAETNIPKSMRDFTFWDKDGFLTTVHCSSEALKQLMPRHENT